MPLPKVKKFTCKYLITENTKRQIRTSKPKTRIFQCYDGGTETFFFPLDITEKTDSSKERKERTLVIDPWPAYASNRIRTTSQIYLSPSCHLERQDQSVSKLPEALKPEFLTKIEAKLARDKLNYKVSDNLEDPLRLQIYREAFEIFIQYCTHYGPFLAEVKRQYDHFIKHLHGKIQKLLPLKEMINAVSIDCENRIKAINDIENAEIKSLEVEREKDRQKIEKMRQECKELSMLVDGLKSELARETEKQMIESDARKLSILAVNDLNARLLDMEQLVKNQNRELEDDPVKLRIALGQCKKTLAAVTAKLTEYECHFEETVPLARFEEVLRQLEDSTRLNEKLQDEITGYANRYDLLQDHCAALNTYRDLYMVQCGYTLRVIGSKGDPNQKLEYIGILLSRWRKLINDKPVEELTDMATEELARYESGALPPLVRPNKPKKSAHD
uniref:Translin-associated factor X-interacting protein 1 n=2 Tax=Schistocephalus solidus TaxID=70667 RepID=A0A0X3NU64_SCHSO